MEVSNDRSSWRDIDLRDDNLNTRYVIRNFKVSKAPSESFYFFRLKQVGQDQWSDGTWYYMTSLEIFSIN